jgi:N-acyl-D-amino-acid deacylase
MVDILIRNGQVIDGSGSPRRKADVAIEGDRIVQVGQLGSVSAKTVIDAAGHVVSPGFVDMHSHSDFSLPILPTADSCVHQGITTSVIGMCGSSPAPLLAETRAEVVAAMSSQDMPLSWDKWSSFGGFLDHLRSLGISTNAVPVVGEGIIRTSVMKFTAAAPTRDQLAAMRHEVERAMDEGAIGLSTGLIYPPGCYTTTEELIEVSRPAGRRNGYYFSHIRGEANTLIQAVEEAIRIGRETGAAVHTAHFKAQHKRNWHLTPLALELFEKARAQGIDATCDMYPYLASSNGVVDQLPDWAKEGSKDVIRKRLLDPATRERITAELIQTEDADIFDRILISSSPKKREWEGHYVAQLARDAHKDPFTWTYDALLEADGDITRIVFGMSEENRKLELADPYMMVGTDGSGLATEGITAVGKPHPRSFGTFPRILGHYVRDEKVMPLEEAVRKMTSLPAKKLRWSDRGLVKEGYKADLVVFNPATVIDKATFEVPHQYPVGIPHVLVNGKLVVFNGKHTGARPGAILGR